MGKNKGYDLAKRQEKILKRMAKPLYKKSDNSTYFVIAQPFGMHRSPAQRGIVDINRLVSWISWLFRRESVVEIVYTMSTRDEIIVRIAEGAVSARFLGKHKYNNILSAGWPWDPNLASCVFAYNYDVNGDPSHHNWREHVASDADAPPGHFRNPYPVPTWAARPSHLSSLARALPDSLPHTPRPSPEPPLRTPTNAQREDAKQEPGYTSHDTNNATAESSSSAQGRVKVEPFCQTIPLITAGEPAYEPTQELRDQIALLNASRAQTSIRVNQEPVTSIKHESSDPDRTRSRSESYGAPATGVGSSDRMPPSVKQEPGDDHLAVSGVEPSQALWEEWARYQIERQTPGDPAALVKQESHPSQFMTQPPIAQSSGSFDLISRGSSPSFQKVKREPAAGEDVRPWKRSKPGIN